MDIRDHVMEALVLKARDYREQDKLLVIVSANNGPEHVIARGAQKTTGSLRSVAQPFSLVSVVLSPPKGGVSFVKEGVSQENFLIPGTAGLAQFAYAAYISELALTAWPERKSAPELYYLLRAVFAMIKLDDDHQRTVRFFELALLRFQGLLPDLFCCRSCGQQVRERQFVLSPQRGALLCEPCAMMEDAPRISAGAVLTMQRMLSVPLTKLPSIRLSKAIAAELDQALAYYLDYHLDHCSKARLVLNEMLK